MRLLEILVLILLLLVILAGMSIPLWWDYAAPHIYRLPQYIAGVINDIMDLLDMIFKRL